MYMRTNKRREGIFIERALVRACRAQSAKLKESRIENGSFSDFVRTAVIERLEKLGVNVRELIANG